jgi:prepilin-type N-terminal cleavage/methylation domain-containing protein
MKKGFTLVEMLVVVAVLITLMTITFRLNKFGTSAGQRATTVERMARLENALSGYYAAFGTYPPVKDHQEQNILREANDYAMQIPDGAEQEPDWEREWTTKHQVEAACLAQPVSCAFPYEDQYSEIVKTKSDAMKLLAKTSKKMSDEAKTIFAAGFDDGVSDNIDRHAQNKNKTDWREVHLFKFGLMSYLLPRYLVMMHGDDRFLQYAQWTSNNELPCDPMTGRPFSSWRDMQQNYVKKESNTQLAHISNIPSQAACARWIANFEGQLKCGVSLTLFGVNVVDYDASGAVFEVGEDASVAKIYTPSEPDSASTSGQYILEEVTMVDGWAHDFYYHSPAPYQSYIVWSAGADGKTFPPFVARDKLSSTGQKKAAEWTKDDIISLHN